MDPFIQYAVAAANWPSRTPGSPRQLLDERPLRRLRRLGNRRHRDDRGAAHASCWKRARTGSRPSSSISTIINEAAGQISIRFGAKGPELGHRSRPAPRRPTPSATPFRHHRPRRRRRHDRRRRRGPDHAARRGRILRHEGPLRAQRRAGSGPPGRSTRDRDGFVMGEGAGILILEELGHALQRGAKIYAEIVGYGMTGDAFHVTAPAADGDGAIRRHAAGPRRTPASPPTTSSTSTPTARRRRSTTRSRPRPSRTSSASTPGKLAVSSTKSMTGHLLGAAGGIEAGDLSPWPSSTRSCRRRSTTRSPTRTATWTTCPTSPGRPRSSTP